MAQKLFVNNTGSTITGQITVRLGSTPGESAGIVPFSVNANSKQMIPYGDVNNPYMDQLELSMIENGSIVLSDQIVLSRGGAVDNEFNMNDTVTISASNNSLVVNTSNTWTV